MPALIGALRVALGINTAEFEAGMARAQVTTRTACAQISTAVAEMQATTTHAFERIRAGAETLGIALGAALFVESTRGAFEYVASMGEVARSMGVTVEQYQILSRAAIDTGASHDGMVRAMRLFQRTLGQARAEVPAAQRAFEALHIDPHQFTNAGDALPHVMEAIHNLATTSEQSAAGARLMGRGFAEMIPFLVQGADGYNRMEEAARASGLATADQAEAAHRAQVAIEELWLTIKTKLGIVVADLIPEVEQAAEGMRTMFEPLANNAQIQFQRVSDGLHGLSRDISEVLHEFQSAMNVMGHAGETMVGFFDRAAAGARQGFINSLPGSSIPAIRAAYERNVAAATPVRGDGVHFQPYNFADEFDRGATAQARRQAAGRPGFHLSGNGFAGYVPAAGGGTANTGDENLDLSSGGRGRGHRGRADHSEQQAAREQKTFDQEMARERIAQLQEQRNQTTDYVEQANIEGQVLVLQREEFRVHLADQVATHQLTAAHAAQLLQAYDQTEIQRRRTIAFQNEEHRTREHAAIEQDSFNLAKEQLQHELDAATTAGERRSVELRILTLTHDFERQKLQEIADDTHYEHHTQQAVLDANARLAQIGAQFSAEHDATIRSTAGPMEQFINALPSTAAAANEALQNLTVQGMQGLTDAISGVIMGTQSMGAAFKNVVTSILADLLKLQIERSIIGPLSGVLNGLFGGGGGSTGGGLSAIVTAAFAKVPGRASGGPVIGGRGYLVGENGPEWFSPMVSGTIIPNHAMGAGGGGTIVNVYAHDAVLTKTVQSWIIDGMQMAAEAGAMGGHQRTVTALTRPALA